MERIKNQIDQLVVYKSSDIISIIRERNDLVKRASQGVEKMDKSSVYSKEEIQTICNYIGGLIDRRYKERREAIIARERENFIF